MLRILFRGYNQVSKLIILVFNNDTSGVCEFSHDFVSPRHLIRYCPCQPETLTPIRAS